jgi:UMF1 family MFS transporter
MFYLADDYACPYEFLPRNESLDESLGKFEAWAGHANLTTSCIMTIHDKYPFQIFGSTVNGGLKHYPSSNIINYDSSLDPFYIEDEDFDSDPNPNITCHIASFGEYQWGYVGNITAWASGCTENKGDDLSSTSTCDADRRGSYGKPIEGFFNYRIQLKNPMDVASGFSGGDGWGDSYTFKITSSNPHILNASHSDFNNVTSTEETSTEEDGSEGKEYYLNFKIRPALMMIGSTTIKITAKSNTEKTSTFSFTYNSIIHTKCPYRVNFLGAKIRPLSFTTTCISFSVIGQALVYFSLAAFGDYGPFRKLLLCYSSLIGCLSCMAFITCDTPDKYGLAGILTVVSNTFFGTSYLFYNAFMPYLTRSHPAFLDAKFEYKTIKTGAATGVGAASKKLLDTYHDTADMISAEGFKWGYISGSFCCFLSIGVIFMIPSLFGMRLIIFMMGCWWFVFAIPLFLFLHTRPGPNFPSDVHSNPLSAVTFSWRRIMASCYAMRHLPETLKFLVSYFFFSDGINTIANVAILFAMQDLGMRPVELTLLAAEGPFFGAWGMTIFRWYQVKKGKDSKTMLLLGIEMLMSIPIYACLGYLRDLGIWPGCPIGVVQKNEMFFVCIIYGMTLGPVQSYARTFYTDLIPPGQEAEYFGVFEISDRGSSWIGPLVVAAVYEEFGVIRHAMWYLTFVIVVGYIMVKKTDVLKGSEDCRRREVLVRMAADRKKFGITKAGAPPSAKKMAGLKSSKLYTGQSGYSNQSGMSTTSTRSTRSSAPSSASPSERSKFSVFNNNKVAQEPGFGGATVVEDTNDGGGFGNATVVEDTNDGGGFGNATVVEDTNDGGGFGNATVVEDTNS